jgi:hypothetical protein
MCFVFEDPISDKKGFVCSVRFRYKVLFFGVAALNSLADNIPARPFLLFVRVSPSPVIAPVNPAV